MADLEVARFTTRSGSPYVVVHDRASRRYLRLDPREFDLLELMDGAHSVKELVIAYYQRHGTLALSRVSGLVHLLRQHGFLCLSSVDAYTALAERLRSSARSAFPSELTSERFDALLERWYRAWGHVFFTRFWLWIGIALGLEAALVVGLELIRGHYAVFGVSSSPLLNVVVLVGVALLALAVHELGHGLAVKHAGRRVHRAGVRLYYGLPAAYVDTSDVWMAPPHLRLLTAFAGPWTGLVLGGLCALAVAYAPDPSIGALMFTAAFVFVVDTIFNFNPLLELDGYYMLIDALDTPLLRPRALAWVNGPLWRKVWRRESLSGEERALTIFGLASVIYGLVAIALAARAWQAWLVPLAESTWGSGDVVARLAVLLLVAALGVPVIVWLWGVASWMVRAVRTWFAWLSGQAATRRHREALLALRAVPAWSEMPEARLLEVARTMRAQDVAPGMEVVRQGEPGARFYVIGRGEFEVLVDSQPRLRLGRGDYFGERALLHRAPRAATVLAVEPSRVFVLEQTDFDALLAHDLAARGRIEAALAYRADVADMPLFRDLRPAELDVLLGRLVPVSADAGEYILRQGDIGHRFYVIHSGAVEVTRDDHSLARLGRGEAFGEIALLLDVPRTASVVALEPTQLLTLDAADFRDLLASYFGRGEELERLSHLRLSTHKRLDELV